MFNFEKLNVWNKAIEFSKIIYKRTADFPKFELFGLSLQLRRASLSISSNIAEGAGRFHKRDFIRFLRLAQGSLYECVSQLHLAKGEQYIDEQSFSFLYGEAEIISKMISGLINSLSENSNPSTINNQPSTPSQ